MNHKHKWQFKRERAKLVHIVKPNFIKELLTLYTGLYPIIPIYEYYNIFCCECGDEMEVKIKQWK